MAVLEPADRDYEADLRTAHFRALARDNADRAELRRRIALEVADPETLQWLASTRAAVADGSIRTPK